MIHVEICIDVFIKLEMQYRRAPIFHLAGINVANHKLTKEQTEKF